MSGLPPMEWPGVLHVMKTVSDRTPVRDMGVVAFALASAQGLAEVVADARLVLTDEQIGVLIGAGGGLIKLAEDIAGAEGEFNEVMARLKRGERP